MMQRTIEIIINKSSSTQKLNFPSTHMGRDKTCDICGDIGIKEALATCSKCCIASEHVYCMADNCMMVPEVWVCEACQSNNNHGEYSKYDEKHYDNIHGVSSNLVDASKRRIDSVRSINAKWQKTVEAGKVKFIEADEVLRLESGASRNIPLRRSVVPKPFSKLSNRISFRRDTNGSTNTITKPAYKKLKPNSTLFPSEFTAPRSRSYVQISSTNSQQIAKTSKESKEVSGSFAPVKEHRCYEKPVSVLVARTEAKAINEMKDQAMEPCQPSPPKRSACTTNSGNVGLTSTKKLNCKEPPVDALIFPKEVETSSGKKDKALSSCMPSPPGPSLPNGKSDRNFQITAQRRNSDHEGRDPLNILATFRLCRPYLPAQHATWKGGFKFLDSATPGEMYGGFRGQPPCRVHRKAYELSQKMPIILQVELLPRGNLLEDLFRVDCFDLNDIAVYFFPTDNIMRSEQNNAHLFEIMENQKAVMRSYVEGVELLVFTSKHLCEDSQNAIRRSKNVESFLWGIFHHAKVDPISCELPLLSHLASPQPYRTNMDNSTITDMDLDMVGGNIVGNIEVAVRSSHVKLPSAVDKHTFPPGFESRLKSSNVLVGNATVKQESCLIDGRARSTLERENVALLGASGRPSRVTGSQSQKSTDDCSFTRSGKYDQVPTHDMVNDLLPTSAPSSSENSSRHRSGILAEGNADEKVAKLGKMKGMVSEPNSQNSPSFKDVVSPRCRDERLQHHNIKVKIEVQDLAYESLGSRRELNSRSQIKIEKPVCWIPPPKNWVKLNTEASSTEKSGAAGVVRDASGEWVFGYMVGLKTCTLLAAELWAIFQGLKLLWNKGYRQILVESISSEAVKSLKTAPSETDFNYPTIQYCRDLLQRDWDCKVCQIPKEMNICANSFATQLKDHSEILVIYDNPPSKLIPILHNDCIRIDQHHAGYPNMPKKCKKERDLGIPAPLP